MAERWRLTPRDLVVVSAFALAEGAALGWIFGGSAYNAAPLLGMSLLVGALSAVASFVVAALVLALAPPANPRHQLLSALVLGAVAAFAVAYLIQPVGRPV